MGGFNTKKESQHSETGGFSESISNAQNTANQQALNQSINQATQQAQSSTTLLGSQAPFLQNLWGQGNALAGSDPGVTGQARGAWGQALNAGINPGVADVIANASAEMGLNFSRNTAPAIRRGAVGTGSLGGSRQGIAEGLAAGEVARAQGNLATNLYTGALDQASRERTAALSMSGQMQSLPWQGLESYGRVLGGPVMESFGSSAGASSGSAYGTSSAASQGTSSGLMNSNQFGSGSGSGSGFGLNVLSKGN